MQIQTLSGLTNPSRWSNVSSVEKGAHLQDGRLVVEHDDRGTDGENLERRPPASYRKWVQNYVC